MKLVDLIYPSIPLSTVGRIAALTAAGALVGGFYGVLHDQVTYTIGPEYFTRFKFDQFSYARPALDSPRLFAGIIGFLASWWVGALTAWVLARVSVKREGLLPPHRVVAKSFALVFATTMVSGVIGYCWGLYRRTTGHSEGWRDWMAELGVIDEKAFMTVGYIHNASYIGGSVGMFFGIMYLIRWWQKERGRNRTL
ncbi:hypothetical protein N9B73_00355 [Verrucomicrobiales bacterium]|jgi:hypothetical protein|nr:hypothetical protein [Verrucomicrobiales bacterium]